MNTGIDPAATLATGAVRALTGRSWPGNVRELRNVIERALLLTDAAVPEADDLVVDAAARSPVRYESDGSGELFWPSTLAELARNASRAMVIRCGGNKSEAARRLGISRPRLQRLFEASASGAFDQALTEDL